MVALAAIEQDSGKFEVCLAVQNSIVIHNRSYFCEHISNNYIYQI